jgi:hypothetical protein
VIGARRPLDPAGDPDGCAALLDEVAAIGTTIVQSTFVHRSLEHYLEQAEALMERFGPGEPQRASGAGATA